MIFASGVQNPEGPDGALYLTDSGVLIEEFAPDNHIRQDYLDLRYDGRVCRVDVETGKVTKVDGGIKFTNDPAGNPGWRGTDGMAFGADGRLYAAVFGQGDGGFRRSYGRAAIVDRTEGRRQHGLIL